MWLGAPGQVAQLRGCCHWIGDFDCVDRSILYIYICILRLIAYMFLNIAYMFLTIAYIGGELDGAHAS